MANTTVDTGHGATITFATSGITFNFMTIDVGEYTIEEIETTYLSTANWKTFMPGDLPDPGELALTLQFDSAADVPPVGVVETATVTFPQADGQTAAATYAGTGFLTRNKLPNLETDVLQGGEYTFRFDGLTGPTFTKATVA